MLRRARLHQFSAPQLAVIGALLLFCSVLSSICTVLYVSLPSHESGLPSSSYLAPICVHPADELRYPADDEPAVDAARVYAPLQLSNCTVYSQRADECQLPPVSLSAVTSMDVAITACGLAYRQDAIVNIKSWLLQRRETVALHFHLVLDDGEPPLTFVEQIKSFRSVFRSWPQAYTDPAHFLVSYYNIASLPAQLSAHLDAFRRCATARLFVAHLLPESLSAVVYVDVDTVAVADTRRLWAEFQLHSPTQFFGIAWAADDSASFKWYQEKVARAFPWPRPWGLNSGVLLLNLTKLRRFRRRVDASVPGNWAVVDGRLVSDGSGGGVVEQSWDDLVLVAFARYGSHFKLGDQDVLNVIAAQDYSHSMWMPIPAAYNWRAGLVNADPPGFDKGLTIVHGFDHGFRGGDVRGQLNPYVGVYAWYLNWWDWPSESRAKEKLRQARERLRQAAAAAAPDLCPCSSNEPGNTTHSLL